MEAYEYVRKWGMCKCSRLQLVFKIPTVISRTSPASGIRISWQTFPHSLLLDHAVDFYCTVLVSRDLETHKQFYGNPARILLLAMFSFATTMG